MSRTWLVGCITLTLLGFSGCRDDSSPGERIDDAMRKLASDAEEVLLEVSEELEEAVETSRDVAREVGDRAVEAADDAIDAADEAFESAEDAISEG
jgi:ElaB/YqjD/DUF883 family membrane-anchored ribosome-binding protein